MRLFITLLLISAFSIAAQVTLPRPSPKATVSQTIGITDIAITYSRPGVKGREIWGKVVPYNEVWRAGANEATTITFSDSVTVEGTQLPAGTYSLHIIPTATEWTIILNKDAKPWMAYSYKQENEVVRIKTKPQASDMRERLLFTFDELTDNSCRLVLEWEKIKLAFKIEVESQSLTLAKARTAISWAPMMQAANYCLDNNVNLDEAMKWIDVSIMLTENYWNCRVKAQLLAKAGKTADAVKIMDKAMEYSKGMQSPPFDLARMQELLADWKKKK